LLRQGFDDWRRSLPQLQILGNVQIQEMANNYIGYFIDVLNTSYSTTVEDVAVTLAGCGKMDSAT
jgi:hypothetical protein